MPITESIPVGAPCWVDLFTTDPDKSIAFYTELFGWTAEEPNADFGGYFNFSRNGYLVAGGMKNDGTSGAPDVWNVYLKSDDAKATVDAAAANGGQIIVPAMDVGDLGTMGVMLDVGNAAIGTWQPGTHTGFGIAAEPGAPGWFELHTRDYDAAVSFYQKVFGWKTSVMSDSSEFRYTTLGEGDNALAGIMDSAGFLPEGAPAAWQVYFIVEDADATVAKIAKLGGTVTEQPEDTPYGRLATALDPTGAQFKIMG